MDGIAFVKGEREAVGMMIAAPLHHTTSGQLPTVRGSNGLNGASNK